METGIGLPNAVPGTTGKQLTDFARAADEAGFSVLGTIDRVVYPNFEPLATLAAAAAVTERIRLATSIILGPIRANAAVLAKQFLTLDALAGGGRAVLGIGAGARDDDYKIRPPHEEPRSVARRGLRGDQPDLERRRRPREAGRSQAHRRRPDPDRRRVCPGGLRPGREVRGGLDPGRLRPGPVRGGLERRR